MEFFLYKKKLIENCEENDKLKPVVNRKSPMFHLWTSVKIDTSSRARETKHMRSRQNVARWPYVQVCTQFQKLQNIGEITKFGIQNGYYFMYGTSLVSILLRRTQ